MAALLAAAQAMVVEIPATTTGFAWWNQDYQGYQTSGKTYGNLELCDISSHTQCYARCPFLKFALDTLPDSCLILSADLNYYQYGHFGAPPVSVLKLIPDPVPGGQDVFWQIEHGPELCSHETSLDSWQRRPFTDFALSALDSCREVGWISLGIDRVSGRIYHCYAYGRNGALPPYLRVEYTLVGVHEPQNTHQQPPRLALTPNPATDRCVAVRRDIAAGAAGTLTLRDVLGKSVESFMLDPSGSTRLDLDDLAPGVYVATLDAAVPRISRELIITDR